MIDIGIFPGRNLVHDNWHKEMVHCKVKCPSGNLVVSGNDTQAGHIGLYLGVTCEVNTVLAL